MVGITKKQNWVMISVSLKVIIYFLILGYWKKMEPLFIFGHVARIDTS